jgi:hypothetical protein
MIRAAWKLVALATASVLSLSIALLAQAAPSGGVQSGSSSDIKLNLSALPANSSVSKTTLPLYADAVAKSGSVDVYRLNSGWSENTVTYNSGVTLGESATDGQPIANITSSLNQFFLIDITSLIQSWIDGSVANNGMALVLATSKGSFSFDSK